MRIDLHCHSNLSDGSEDPQVLFEQARRAELQLFCLTDHDTWIGCPGLVAQAPDGLKIIHGAELSCRADGRNAHLLAYWPVNFEPESEAMQRLEARLESVRKERHLRLYKMGQRLVEAGHPLDLKTLISDDPNRVYGRPVLAQALVQAGVCSSAEEAFRRFLHDKAAAYIPSPSIELEEALQLGQDAGAKMSLAHPHTIREPSVVRDWFVRYRAMGLEGIEAFYLHYSKGQRNSWLRIAQELDLVSTGGSDFHGGDSHLRSPLGVELPLSWSAKLKTWLDLT